MTVPLPGRTGARVRTIPLQVDQLPGGGLRISSPAARGWAGTARTSHELARVVQEAFQEVAVASYARAKGVPYDLDVLTIHVPGDPLAAVPQRRMRRRTTRHKSYAVEDWTRMEDGRWRSPAGRAYRADSTAVQNVIRKRREKGLPT